MVRISNLDVAYLDHSYSGGLVFTSFIPGVPAQRSKSRTPIKSDFSIFLL